MPIKLAELIDKLPSDTAERVKKAKDKHNTRVRNALRHETGLKLNRSDSDSSNANWTSVPIKVVPGVPAELRDFSIPDQHRLAVLLSPWRNQLRDLRDSSKCIQLELIPTISVQTRGYQLINGRQVHLKPAGELAEDLLKEGDKYNLAKEILAIEKDILGRYHYPRHNLFGEADCSIELYWGIIGLISSQIGVDVEDLTFVVLAHELSHAYTHIGLDIDDRRWEWDSFHASQTSVVEGLAQHYTMLVSKRIASQVPHALHTYERLLECQTGPYLVQIPWEAKFTPEHMRLALISTRRHEDGVTLKMFEAALENARRQLS
jgi:hypothetical protein